MTAVWRTPGPVSAWVRVVLATALVGSGLVGSGLVGSPAAAEPTTQSPLTVRIDTVTPDLVTTAGPPALTVTGTVTNGGDRPVHDVAARLERGGAVASSAGLRTSLDGGGLEPVGDFINVAGQLDRGQAAGFSISVPIAAGSRPSLGITEPGVYPMVLTVDGTPDGGEATRMDQDRFLLPITGVPPASGDANSLADAVAPDTGKPVGMTMLWPLADKPRLAPGVPGGTTPVRLMDDDLAVSLDRGGRLDTLLAAAEFAVSPDAIDPAAGLDRALCLAVDPDLLVTVNAMTAGYVVADASDGLGTAAHPGTGQAAATAWLDRLRTIAKRLCVVATPYAQADLGALNRIGDTGLSAAATSTGADVVDRILGVASTRGVTVLGDGPLTSSAVALLDSQGPTVAIAAGQSAESAVRRVSAQVVEARFNPAVGAALAAVGTDPSLPTYLDDALAVAVSGDSPVARRESAMAALLWLPLHPEVEPRTQILLPPLKWSPQPDDARAMLSTIATAVRAGLAKPRPLTEVVNEAAGAGPADQDEPELPAADGFAGRFDDDVVVTIGAQVRRLGGLAAALTTDTRTGLTGAQYTAPLREDMLRALSQTDQPQERNSLARQRLPVVGKTIEDLFGAVSIVSPGDSYTLATERSALPLALRNDLAVPIRVRLVVDAPPGMTVTDVGELELPPGYLPLKVPVEVHSSQRVAVDVTLRTPDGVALGEPVRLSVHSNAYGKVLFALTLGGGLVLAALVGRRLYHRFRGQPDRADLDRPWRPLGSAGEEQSSPASQDRRAPASQDRRAPASEDRRAPASEDRRAPASEDR